MYAITWPHRPRFARFCARRFTIAALACATTTLSLAATAQQDIVVTSIQAMTGPTAFAGVRFQESIRLVVEDVNTQGGIHGQKIRLIERDNGGDKGQVITLANQAADRDRAVLVLGPTATADTMPAVAVLNDKRVPSMGFSASDAILQSGPWALKYRQNAQVDQPLFARYILENTSVRKIALVFDRTNEALLAFKDVFRAAFTAGGGVIVSEDAIVSSDANFLPLATKLKAMAVDAVYLSAYTDQTANIIIQMRQAGLPDSVRFFGPLSMASPQFLTVVGKAGEGATAVTGYVSGLDRALNRTFEADYKARYGTAPDSFAADGYSLALIAVATLREAGPNPTREKVRDAYMRLRDVPVVVGSGLWNHTERKPNFGTVIVTVQNGQFVAAP